MNFNAKKVAFVGDASVGKSTILAKYLDRTGDIAATTAVELVDVATSYTGHPVKLSVWDTSGDDKYDVTRPMYVRGASCAVLVFSMTDRKSFESLEKIYRETRECGVERFLVVANKSDLDAVVEFSEAKEWCNRYDIRIIKTSAKSGSNIDHLIRAIAELVVEDEPEKLAAIDLAERERLRKADRYSCGS